MEELDGTDAVSNSISAVTESPINSDNTVAINMVVDGSDREDVTNVVNASVSSSTSDIPKPSKKPSKKRKLKAIKTPEELDKERAFAAAVNYNAVNSVELVKAKRDRERKPRTQKYVAKTKRLEKTSSAKLKSITPAMRVAEFPQDYLITKAGGVLWCDVCYKSLELKKSIVQMHTKSASHVWNVHERRVLKLKKVDISELITARRETVQDRLIELDLKADVYRFETVEMLLN